MLFFLTGFKGDMVLAGIITVCRYSSRMASIGKP
jgi:hypothetical protein